MAASSNTFFGIRDEEQLKQQQANSSQTIAAQSGSNLPGTPNPDAEVIALSPKSLMATSRFICEVCQKGFQREQNLQLHRRGHGLPWKLRQKSTKEVPRKVYLCPEPTCVHHDPSNAFGDLMGIKKHFSRKHGEKKWKCDKCSRKYTVQSDCKAHSETCSTREYRCDCGTLFSRRDSFITHRAFCDAIAQESARLPPIFSNFGNHLYGSSTNLWNLPHQVNVQLTSSQDQNRSDLLRVGGSLTSHFNPSPFHFAPNQLDFNNSENNNSSSSSSCNNQVNTKPSPFHHGLMQLRHELQNHTNNSSPFKLGFFANGSHNPDADDQLMDNNDGSSNASLFSGDVINGNQISSVFNNAQNQEQALLKSAQMGATTSSNDWTHHISDINNSFANEKNIMFGALKANLCGVGGRGKLERSLSNAASTGDRLTRDFLGVGSKMKGMEGRVLGEGQQPVSLDFEFMNSSSSSTSSSSSSSSSFTETGCL